jgi:hypothetical protein
MKNSVVLLILAGCLLGLGAVALLIFIQMGLNSTYTVDITEYHPPPSPPEDVLVDDRLEDKTPTFDPELVDRRPLGEWLVNQSAAVVRLDVLTIKPDHEGHLLTLHESYAAAVAAARARHSGEVLPSVNMLDGKAKQFDDGLYAALDQAYYQGLKDKLLGHVHLIERLHGKAGKDSPAAPFLAAGLHLAGVNVEVTNTREKAALLEQFQANEVASKPTGFYTWNETLSACFRFLRFFQREFSADELHVPLALARVLAQDESLQADYQKALAFYARLTNPSSCVSVADLVGLKSPDPVQFSKLCKDRNVAHVSVALFPPSTSRETVLFEKLFPMGLPANADLMRELIRRIRSGQVDLKPGPASGWYDHQVYALETLLLPERGEERHKLLLTKNYKKRMLEAFQALITKRRETHVRQLVGAKAGSAAPLPSEIKPRLRAEPCPSYYLRTARAYAFLANFLEGALGKDTLQSLHGLRKDGQRELDLHAELHFLRDLFYGLYLVSADDIGLKPAFAPDELVDQDHCNQFAAGWLAKVFDDKDLAADTRVAIPILIDPVRKVSRVWATLGVRLAKLKAGYARPPQIRPVKEGDWRVVESHRLGEANYLIPVEEFAEVEIQGFKALSREEFRAVCDREKTKEAITAALRKWR